jgi:hypothetical protein
MLYLCRCIFPINFRTVKTVFMKLGTYIMAPKLDSKPNFMNSSHQSRRLYAYIPIFARQEIGKNVTAAPNPHVPIDEFWRRIFICCPYHIESM